MSLALPGLDQPSELGFSCMGLPPTDKMPCRQQISAGNQDLGWCDCERPIYCFRFHQEGWIRRIPTNAHGVYRRHNVICHVFSRSWGLAQALGTL